VFNFSVAHTRGISGRKLPRMLWRGAWRALWQLLRLIPPSTAIPILQGPGRGLRWIVGSLTHGCWLGSYEINKQTLVAELVRPGDVVYRADYDEGKALRTLIGFGEVIKTDLRERGYEIPK